MTETQTALSPTGTERKWPRYPAYRTSGIPWLGEIPAGWEMKRLYHVFEILNGATPSSSVEAFWDGDIPWVTPEDLGQLSSDTLTATTRQITMAGYASCGTSLAPSGSLILSTRAPIGHLAIAGIDLCTNQGCRCLVFRQSDDRRFFYYQLLAAKSELQSLGQGSTFQELGRARLRTVALVRPTQGEQRAITAFLDRETATIDAIIEKKERLIALLEEKRAAVISHAVTKGLDPSVPMKDSGVPWLGEIPAHWEVMRLKFLAKVRSGVAKGRDLNGKDTIELPYLRVANVQDGFLDLSDVATIDVAPHEIEQFLLKTGDVLMNEGGDFDKLGRGTVWQAQIEPCIHQNHVFAVRPYSHTMPDWLALITLARYAKHYFMAKSKQSTNLASISATNIGGLPVVLPPAAERSQIESYLTVETSTIDSIVVKAQEQITKLQEYRTALISAAVTGKIDVRGEVSPDGYLREEL